MQSVWFGEEKHTKKCNEAKSISHEDKKITENSGAEWSKKNGDFMANFQLMKRN